MIPIPQDIGKWKVSYGGDVLGVLKRAENVNFDEEGYVTPSPKSVSLYGSTTNALFGLPLNILWFNGKYNVLTDQDVWEVSTDLTLTNITDAETDRVSPNTGSDSVIWQSRLYVSGDASTDVRHWNGTAWTDISSAIAINSNSFPHPMAVMGNFSGGHLCIANGASSKGNVVTRWDTSHSLAATLTLNADYIVTCLLYRESNLYIGTKTLNGSEAKVFVWSGAGTAAQQEFGVGSDWVFSMCEYQDSIAIVTNAGQILRFNAGGFDTSNPIANFPVFYTPYRWTNNTSGLIGKVHMRGMRADGDLLYINVNGSIGAQQVIGSSTDGDGLFLPNQPSGVWCYDPKVGLYCRSYSTTDGYQTLTASSLSSNTLTLSANINSVTGDPIYCLENGSLTGILDDTNYFIIKVDANQVKLAATRADAVAGNAVTLGGAVTSASFRAISYEQHGELYSAGEDVGGIGLVSEETDPPIFPRIFSSPYLWGFEDDSNNTYLNSLSLGSSIGHLHVARVLSRYVRETWQSILVKFFNFFMGSDRIITRYSTVERQDLPTPLLSGTYSNTRAIGSTSSNLDLAQAGDTVVIVSGDGAGQRRTINESGVVGDEITFTEPIDTVASGGAVTFYILPHKTSTPETTTGTATVGQNYLESPIGATSTFLDLSIEMRGQMKVPQLQLNNTKSN